MMRCEVGGWSSWPSIVRSVRHRISFVAACATVGPRAAGDNHSVREQLWTPRRTAAQVKVAIVGAGIAGLAAAYRLDPHCDVVLYEAEPRAGGHAYTVVADGHALDAGFVVCNERNYPQFLELMRELGVGLRPSTMSFSVRCERCDLEFSGHGLGGLFAQRRNLVRPSFARLLLDLGRFFRNARAPARRSGGRRPHDRRVPRARRLRARADRSLPRADGRGHLVVVAGAHARDARALLHPLLRQPRPARRARRAAVVHDRGRFPDAT